MSFRYESESEIEKVVRDFESCATPKTEFKHRDHLTVGIWYLQTLTPAEAVDHMRTALLRFVDHHGIDRQKYSEPVTVFWIDVIAEELAGMGPDVSLVEKCNRVISTMPVSLQARKPAARVEGEE